MKFWVVEVDPIMWFSGSSFNSILLCCHYVILVVIIPVIVTLIIGVQRRCGG